MRPKFKCVYISWPLFIRSNPPLVPSPRDLIPQNRTVVPSTENQAEPYPSTHVVFFPPNPAKSAIVVPPAPQQLLILKITGRAGDELKMLCLNYTRSFEVKRFTLLRGHFLALPGPGPGLGYRNSGDGDGRSNFSGPEVQTGSTPPCKRGRNGCLPVAADSAAGG